ncbi:hypothetical protein J116_010895 [Streptomyces thermolilacinus SPC6]|uniref:Uncharacterized protein n=1 Tax=Streptomyces thermolilacinus SPC6 TaxID=1306406 RepID=A0A1D3DRH3_9ACTN|nr:hypothetical protein J116_010895 [Streptomyces thermolilacinus SPC6]
MRRFVVPRLGVPCFGVPCPLALFSVALFSDGRLVGSWGLLGHTGLARRLACLLGRAADLAGH